MSCSSYFLFLCFVHAATCQLLPSSFPHNYPGIPNLQADFADSGAWQQYFLVKDPLPNVTFPLPRSFAGNIPVNRQGHPNATLFFYAFEHTTGSLTSSSCENPWIIWLNGGPGSSSLAGLFFENGPIRINPDRSASPNSHSWDKAADTLWIDQPVGTGWATSDALGYAADEDQVGSDFFGFLSNLVQVFPSLACRPLHIVGESYAGRYIPYITKTYFGLSNPPVKLKKIAIGDGTIAAFEVYRLAPIVNVLETYPQIIGFDPAVLEYFREQAHLCHLDINLTYPQAEIIPTIQLPVPPLRKRELSMEEARSQLRRAKEETPSPSRFSARARERRRSQWKRSLVGRPNGTIDPFYGCDLFGEMIDYALNFTFPWNKNDANGFNPFSVPDALDPESPLDASVFLNDPRVRSAIHAPTSKDWSIFFNPTYPFGNTFGPDPSPPAMNFLSELAANSSAKGVSWILYSGNDDSQDAHRGTEITIQNTTFGGIRGFKRKPSTPWFDDQGNFGGIVHQERNVTYVLFNRAGHQVPLYQPNAALFFLKEFVLGDNQLGLVKSGGHDHVDVVGGEVSSLAAGPLPGARNPIFYGSGTTQSSTAWPYATVSLWNSFIATLTGIPAPTAT